MPLPQSVIEARAQVVEEIVDSMKTHQFSWVEQWQDHLSARNAVSGRPYHGGNLLHLAAAAKRNGYDDPRWVSFRQANENGWKIKKGTKGSKIEFWKSATSIIEEDGEEVKVEKYPRCMGIYTVFNASCIDGIEPLELPEKQTFNDAHLFNMADDFINTSSCPVYEDDCQAYFSIKKNEIHLPNRFAFLSAQSFLRTLWHEQAHASSVPLNRELSGSFGSTEYAKEELLAELSSALIGESVGLKLGQESVDPMYYENHVAYLQSWISALQEDPSYLFKIASKASQVADYIIERYNGEDIPF